MSDTSSEGALTNISQSTIYKDRKSLSKVYTLFMWGDYVITAYQFYGDLLAYSQWLHIV